MELQELSTPCLVLDQSRLVANLGRMRRRLQGLGVSLRPHAKTAKCIEALDLALAGNERKIAVSTLKEAEHFFAHGIRDITYAVGIAPRKLDRAARLISCGAELTLILDSLIQARALAAAGQQRGVTFKALIEIDCDGHRAGVAPEDPALLEIGAYLHDQPGAALQGILTHAGESYRCPDRAAIARLARQERLLAVRCAERLGQRGLPCPVVSVGSTPTLSLTEDLAGVTEARPGVYMFNDLTMVALGICSVDQIALSILATVIGHQRNKGWVLIDAGFTALSHDPGSDGVAPLEGYGAVCDLSGSRHEGLTVRMVNQEHGVIARADGGALDVDAFPVDSLVRVLPNHACATATLHSGYHVVEGGNEVTAFWERLGGW